MHESWDVLMTLDLSAISVLKPGRQEGPQAQPQGRQHALLGESWALIQTRHADDPHVYFRASQGHLLGQHVQSMAAAGYIKGDRMQISRHTACGRLVKSRISTSPVAGPFGRAGGKGMRGRLARCLCTLMAVEQQHEGRRDGLQVGSLRHIGEEAEARAIRK